jgi:hypothetical protein
LGIFTSIETESSIQHGRSLPTMFFSPQFTTINENNNN